MYILTGIITFLIILTLLFSNSFIQTVLAKNAASYFSKKLNTTIDIRKLEISLSKKILLRDFLILDQKADTLLFSHLFSVKLKQINSIEGIYHFKSIEIDNAKVNLQKDEGQFNFSFIPQYLKSTSSSTEVLEKDTTEITKSPLNIRIHNLTIRNSSFIYQNKDKPKKNNNSIDFTNIQIETFNLTADDCIISNDTITTQIRYLALKEHSGFQVDSLSGAMTFDPQKIQVDSLLLKTQQNDLNMDLTFSYQNMADFRKFINNVKIKANFRPSVINLSEVGFFAPVMYNMDNKIKITGKINGYVSNFKAKDLRFALGKSTHFQGDIKMNGLPYIKETFSHININHFVTTISDVKGFRLPTENARFSIPETLAKFGKTSIDGKFTGFYNDFVSYADFETEIGHIATDVMLKVNNEEEVSYLGRIVADDFNAGILFNTEKTIGTLNFAADIVGSGITFETADIRMDGVIDSLDLYNNIYNTVRIFGELSDQKFLGRMKVEDDNINLDFDGSIDYGRSIPAYNFTANVNKARLYDINLYKKDSTAVLSTIMKFNFMGDKPDNLQGIIKLDSTLYYESGEYYSLNNLLLSITRNSADYTVISLFSDIIDASVEGEMTIRDLPFSLNRLGNKYLKTFFPIQDTADNNQSIQNFNFDIDLKNPEPLYRMFAPDLKISENTKIRGEYNNIAENLFIEGNANEIEFKGQKLKDWYFKSTTLRDKIVINTSCNEYFLSDTISVLKPKIICSASNDSIDFLFLWGDTLIDQHNFGRLAGDFNIYSPDHFKFRFDESLMRISGIPWTIDPQNYFEMDSTSIYFSNMSVQSDHQELMIHGKISEIQEDSLYLSFNDFDLSNSDLFLNNFSVDLDGKLNGNFILADYYALPTYLVDLAIDSLYFNKEKLGEAVFKTTWDPLNQSFDVLGEINYTGNIGTNKTLELTGYYYPYSSDDNFDIDILLRNYKLKTLEPFLKSFTSRVSGNASGKVSLTGTNQKPDFKGEVNVKHVSMLIDYINVAYNFADKLRFDERTMYFDNITLYDSLNNQAVLNGKIIFDNVKDIELDLNLKTDKIAGLNTTRTQNELFYGQAHATGNIKIAGPASKLNMSIAVKTDKGTKVYIPISYGTSVTENDYIVFVNSDETTEEQPEEYNVDLGGFGINLDLDITQEADIQIFLPYQMGNIRAKGNGALKIDISPDLEFTMNGEYTIAKGSFFFTLQNIINRNFEIKRGSRISWSGDPYNAIIDMQAVYTVKTKLGDFGPPEDSASRVNVDCIIGLKNSLLNPQIIFTIDFPDLKESEKQYIYSRLDTTDQDMMSQQMLSLLVLNSFSSNTSSGGSVGFNTYSLLTNQINNWLSQISNDFDIGVNYLPGDDLSAQEVEVALSTQLFDDRVLIDGNVGMRGSEEAQKTNEIVGEVNVEVILTPDGRWRAKAFNKSNDEYLYKNYSPYTQGVGIFYTKEFNHFGELFTRKEKKKKENKPTESDKE